MDKKKVLAGNRKNLKNPKLRECKVLWKKWQKDLGMAPYDSKGQFTGGKQVYT